MGLRKLPMEILFFIIELLHIDYIFDLARTCRQFYSYILRNDAVARMILSKYRHSLEASDAFDDDEAGVPHAFSKGLRRLAKRRAAVRSAEPYSISVIARVNSSCFTNGVLCYAFGQKSLHIRDTNGPATRELVIDIPAMLKFEVLEPGPWRVNFSLKPVYYSDGIVSCLFVTAECYNLVVVSTRTLEVLSTRRLPTLSCFVVRNDSDYLFYGIKTRELFVGPHQWTFWRLDLRTREWTAESLVLWEFPGAEVDRDVCFEIFDGQFYCLSNNFSSRTHRMDPDVVNEWNSFYRLIRFPVSNPKTEFFEEPPMRNMWRRNVNEGPSNRYWDRMQLKVDQSSGKLVITESRSECLEQCMELSGKFSNNCYRKEVSFTPTWDTSLIRQPFLEALGDELRVVPSSVSEDKYEDKCKDKCEDETPYGITYVEPRLHRDVHIGNNASPGIRGTFRSPWARVYHPSCETFIELVGLGPPGTEDPRHREFLGLRVRPKTCHSSLKCEALEPESDMVWPRHQHMPIGQKEEKLANMLWPDHELRPFDLRVNDQSLVYSAIANINLDTTKHLVFISFDPAKTRNKFQSKKHRRPPTIAEGCDAKHFPSWARLARARDMSRMDFGESCRREWIC
ncbi:hypothetical protein EDB81DRAFT_850000 [Dactylonectria macrodidyma]|uniref:F-box domain-containing protein n=1 Tax=Dactylonectria macrodidyma TaxID=307937 RepID=A0A9P9FTW8_9HYPO|nr:hypothetical protein EDB81DRAFT_850000 [Dactylonectria macrodidyma]